MTETQTVKTPATKQTVTAKVSYRWGRGNGGEGRGNSQGLSNDTDYDTTGNQSKYLAGALEE